MRRRATRPRDGSAVEAAADCTIPPCHACAGHGAGRRRSSCSTATLPELRRGLTESAARTVAYELFEKLGYGAVAVTDRNEVLAFVGAGADHHGAGDRPIRPVYEAIARGEPLLAPLGIRTECEHPACPLGAAAVVPLRLHDGPVGAVVAYATAGSPLDEARGRDARTRSAASCPRSCSCPSSTRRRRRRCRRRWSRTSSSTR